MKKINIRLNILAPLQIGLTLFLGFSGLVSWWIIGLIWFMQASFDIEIQVTKLDVFYRVFNAYALPREGSIEKGDNMKLAKIISRKDPKEIPNGAIQHSFELAYYDENGNLGEKTLWRSAFLGDKSDPEFVEAIRGLGKGDVAEFGFTKNPNNEKYWNITSVMPTEDVNDDMPSPTPAAKPSTSKDTHITNLALFKACTPFFSGNFQMFIDHMGGDFEAGLEKMTAALFALYKTAQKDVK